ncbi:hypothetical protein BDR03DRAFT_1095990 [Suillus americanus]|nr:hypothetical protein BDR03DRAFT_1095990 [Suillus americanus]
MSAVHHADLIGLFAKFLPLKEKAKRLPWIHSKFPNCLMHPPNSNLQEALEKDIPASKSGRTLMEILSLSFQNLKSYTIEKTVEAQDLQNEIELMKKRQETLESRLEHLETEREAQKKPWRDDKPQMKYFKRSEK